MRAFAGHAAGGAHFQAYPAFLLPTLPISGGPPVIYSPLGRAVI
jgi:hypothetical protein